MYACKQFSCKLCDFVVKSVKNMRVHIRWNDGIILEDRLPNTQFAKEQSCQLEPRNQNSELDCYFKIWFKLTESWLWTSDFWFRFLITLIWLCLNPTHEFKNTSIKSRSLVRMLVRSLVRSLVRNLVRSLVRSSAS